MRDIIRANTCTEAWLQATAYLQTQNDWRDYNLVLEISSPLSLSEKEKRVFNEVNNFLISHEKHSVNTVINTIFPASFYAKHGADGLFNNYREILPTLTKHEDFKWGTYFQRMISRIDKEGKEIRPLEYLIEKLRKEANNPAPKRAIFELNLIEPFLDIPIYDATSDKHFHMGGPCLSHVSFKLKPDRSLILTALYRSHYYIQRALGNFYGLALLQDFVAKQANIKPAEFVCHSTMAILDTEKTKKSDVANLLETCKNLMNSSEPSAK